MSDEIRDRYEELEDQNDKRVTWKPYAAAAGVFAGLFGPQFIVVYFADAIDKQLLTETLVNTMRSIVAESQIETAALRKDVGDAIGPFFSRIQQAYLAFIAVLAASMAFCIGVLTNMYRRVKNIDKLTLGLHNRSASLHSRLDDLESRHNIIQSGTDYGRVLALRDFENKDLGEGDPFFIKYLTEDHGIVSTLVLDRAEELLTSAKYMKFFIDLTLPKRGYFRLVLAREPKNLEGLSAYGEISRKLGYETAVLSLDCWRSVIRPELGSLLPDETVRGVTKLIERNAELGLKETGIRLDENDTDRIAAVDKLIGARLEDTMYACRLGLPKAERTEKKTIYTFRHNEQSNHKGISRESVHAYWKLLGSMCKHQTMDSFDPEALKIRFSDNRSEELTRSLKVDFG